MKYAIALLGIAALGFMTPAEARDGCGRGWHFDGFRCVPMHYGPPGYAYRGGVNRPIFGENSFGRPEVWFRPYVDRSGRLQCAQPNYTVQDGVCKRYRGY